MVILGEGDSEEIVLPRIMRAKDAPVDEPHERPRKDAVISARWLEGQLNGVIEELKQLLKPGDEVYTDLKHVSRYGMERAISVKIIRNNQILDISYLTAIATDFKLHNKYEGIKIVGCGMDMGFAIVYDLSRVLYADTFECIGKSCPSNDHFNGDRNYEPHIHSDGGYALRQRWL